MDDQRPIVFLDANVVVKGMMSRKGAAKGILLLATQRLLRVTTAELVTLEIERALQRLDVATDSSSEYAELLRRSRISIHPAPSPDDVFAAMPTRLPVVRHQADVAVVVVALKVGPDWLVSEKDRHFSPKVAKLTGLRIATPQRFLESLFSF